MPTKHQELTDELQEKACLFAAGALSPDERKEYLRHLEEDDCAVCREEVRAFEATASLLSLGIPPHSPSRSVKERLMGRVHASLKSEVKAVKEDKPIFTLPPPKRKTSWQDWTVRVVAAAASVALVFVIYQNDELRTAMQSLSSRIAQLESQLNDERVRLARLTSPDVRVVQLGGQAQNASASGHIFWDRSERRWLFYVYNLPTLTSDRSYQLWFVPVAGNPVSATVFNTDANGTARIEVNVPQGVDQLRAAAVTTEPAGGLPQPSGAFALLGAFE